jgi:hypothetical protein
VSEGVYDPRSAAELVRSYLSQPPPEDVNWSLVNLLAWSNGFALEWGEELLYLWIWKVHGKDRAVTFRDNAKDLLEKAVNRDPVKVLFASMLGRMMSLIGVIGVFFWGYKYEKRMGAAFLGGFSFEIFEGLISYIGEAVTFGLPNVIYAFGFAAVAGIVTGLGAAAMASEPMNSPKRKLAIGGLELVGLAILARATYVAFIVNGQLQ